MTRTCSYMDPHNVPGCTECGQSLDLCVCVGLDDQAHDRLKSPDGIVIAMVRGELAAAREESPYDTHLVSVLTEKIGKLAQLLREHDEHQGATTQEVLRGAVQVASMAIRVATEGDADFTYVFPTVEADLPRGPVGGQYD